jgi:type II secretory pathway component PulJ
MRKVFVKKFQKGASLVELLIYFALLGIILVIAVDIMLATGEFSLESASKNELQDNARFINARLAYDIRQADSITTPANLGDSSNTLVLLIGTETHTYSLVGANLEYQKETGPPPTTQTANINSNFIEVNSLSFQRLGTTNGKHTIKITLELEATKSGKGNPEQKIFETVVGTR